MTNSMETRLKAICEAVFPMPVKCCGGTKRDIKMARVVRASRYRNVLNGLTEADQERQLAEWEQKYNVSI